MENLLSAGMLDALKGAPEPRTHTFGAIKVTIKAAIKFVLMLGPKFVPLELASPSPYSQSLSDHLPPTLATSHPRGTCLSSHPGGLCAKLGEDRPQPKVGMSTTNLANSLLLVHLNGSGPVQ